MRVFYEEMKEKLQSILVKHGFDEKRAEESAKNFADSSLDGVYSHGYQRFPRVIDYIQKGYIDVNAVPEKSPALVPWNDGTAIWEWEISMQKWQCSVR